MASACPPSLLPSAPPPSFLHLLFSITSFFSVPSSFPYTLFSVALLPSLSFVTSPPLPICKTLALSVCQPLTGWAPLLDWSWARGCPHPQGPMLCPWTPAAPSPGLGCFHCRDTRSSISPACSGATPDPAIEQIYGQRDCKTCRSSGERGSVVTKKSSGLSSSSVSVTISPCDFRQLSCSVWPQLNNGKSSCLVNNQARCFPVADTGLASRHSQSPSPFPASTPKAGKANWSLGSFHERQKRPPDYILAN